MKIDQTQSMGIGELGSPNITFARKFRWTMKGQNLPPDFFKTLNINHKEKTIEFDYYEVLNTQDTGFHAQVWADELGLKHLLDETLTLQAYDGCGTVLYTTEFFNLTLLEDNISFDYESSDISTRHIKVAYEHHASSFACNAPIPTSEWKLDIKFGKKWIKNLPVITTERPVITMEEVELNHLNAKTTVPGKATFLPLNIKLKTDPRLVRFCLGEPVEEIRLKQYKAGKIVETWKIEKAFFKKASFVGQEINAVLNYTKLSYIN